MQAALRKCSHAAQSRARNRSTKQSKQCYLKNRINLALSQALQNKQGADCSSYDQMAAAGVHASVIQSLQSYQVLLGYQVIKEAGKHTSGVPMQKPNIRPITRHALQFAHSHPALLSCCSRPAASHQSASQSQLTTASSSGNVASFSCYATCCCSAASRH